MRTQSFVVFATTVLPRVHAAYANTRLAMAEREVSLIHRRVAAKAKHGEGPLLRALVSSTDDPASTIGLFRHAEAALAGHPKAGHR